MKKIKFALLIATIFASAAFSSVSANTTSPVAATAQSQVGHKINSYKYIYIENQGNQYGLEERYHNFFVEIGFTVLTDDEAEKLSDKEREKMLVLNYTCTVVAGAASSQTLTLRNVANKIVYSRSESAYTLTANSDMRRAAKKIMYAIRALGYKYEGEE